MRFKKGHEPRLRVDTVFSVQSAVTAMQEYLKRSQPCTLTMNHSVNMIDYIGHLYVAVENIVTRENLKFLDLGKLCCPEISPKYSVLQSSLVGLDSLWK